MQWRLTTEQAEIVRFARSGHILITGHFAPGNPVCVCIATIAASQAVMGIAIWPKALDKDKATNVGPCNCFCQILESNGRNGARAFID